MIVTIILIGITVAIGGIIATTTTDIVQTGLVLDAVEIKRLAIQNTGSESYITGMIKNTGNTDIHNAMVIVTDGGDVFCAPFGSLTNKDVGRLNSGVSKTVNQEIYAKEGSADTVKKCNDAANEGSTVWNGEYWGSADGKMYDNTAGTFDTDGDHRLEIGKKYLVEVRAQIAGGGEYSVVKTISPQ